LNSVFRGLAIYFFLLLIFRMSGRRSLAQITTFDFVLLLIISEAAQNAMVGQDYSFTNSALLITTLVGVDIGLSLLARRWTALDKLLNDVPLILVEDGRVLEERLKKSRVQVSDILSAARELQGLERIEQIKYAVLERGGEISIIPKN
jgi:uncharacterized membrane protein YcaP (DUF421 family)